MAVAIESLRSYSLETEPINPPGTRMSDLITNQSYWWSTSGRDLSRMLHEANYPEEVRHRFLTWYRDNICSQLGSPPDTNSIKSGISRDGNPFEYSFELKGSMKAQSVRFGVDLSIAGDHTNPLSIVATQKAVDSLMERTPGFDDTWYRALTRWFVHSHLPTSDQQALVAKIGYQSAVMLGFDIYPRIAVPGGLPIMAKVYFTPCFVAAAKRITRWQAVRLAIRQLPDIDLYPNILRSLALIEDYLSERPRERENGARYLATDFVAPNKSRLKIYMRYPGTSFDEIWDYYTLGGRIPGLEEDKEKMRDLMKLVSGPKYDAEGQTDLPEYTKAARKATILYFSLSAENLLPAPKLYICPSSFATNDEETARGMDTWLRKYGQSHGGKSIEDQVKHVFTHRKLNEKTGIFTFIAIGRKEHPTKKDLSVQAYLSPELYENPRM